MMEELGADEEPKTSSRALVCRSRVDSLEGRFGSFILGGIVGSTVIFTQDLKKIGREERRSVDTRKRGEENVNTKRNEEDVD